MTLPDGPRGRSLALALALVVPLSLWLGAVQPLVAAWQEGEAVLEEKHRLAERLAGVAARLPMLREAVASVRGEAEAGRQLLPGPSEAVAGATLQAALGAILGTGGGSMASAETLPPQPGQGGFTRIGVRIAFTGDLGLLTDTLAGIEAARPALSVDAMQVRNAAGAGIEEEAGAAGALAVSLDVFGLWKP